MSIEQFVNRKGSVGIITALSDRGMTWSELESELLISSSTLKTRREDALEIGLVEMKAARRYDNNRTVTEYHLTDMGEHLAEAMARGGLMASYREMRAHKRALDRQKQELVDALKDVPSEFLSYPEEEDETLIDYREDVEDDAIADKEALTEEIERYRRLQMLGLHPVETWGEVSDNGDPDDSEVGAGGETPGEDREINGRDDVEEIDTADEDNGEDGEITG